MSPLARTAFTLVTIVALVPALAFAAETRLADHLDPATAAEVGRIVDDAGARGLPTGPLVSKAIEGAAKGARADRIVAAVRAQATALDSARARLGTESSEAELVAGAGALIAGAPGDSLARLRDCCPQRRSLVVPLVVLADLVARRVPGPAASAAVLVAARAGAGDADLLRLRRRIEHDIDAGAAPGPTAIMRAKTLDVHALGVDKRSDRPSGTPGSRP